MIRQTNVKSQEATLTQIWQDEGGRRAPGFIQEATLLNNWMAGAPYE